jgi:predicted RNA-binding protein with PIN domain
VSARFLLIDGYNLLHAAGMARAHYGPGDLKRCRERLLRHLAGHLSAAEIARTLVVFDAREPPPDRPSRLVIHGMQVLFANPGGDADLAIQESLSEHASPRRVTLVSSDHVLQQAARRHRADYIDSEEFISRLNQRRQSSVARKPSDSDDKPSDQLTPAEAEHWSRYFGDVSAVLESERRANESAPPQDVPADHSAASAGSPPGKTPEPEGQSPRLQRRARKPAPKSKNPKDVGDIEFWMGVFRGLPEASELARGGSSIEGLVSESRDWLDDFLKDDRPRKRTD